LQTLYFAISFKSTKNIAASSMQICKEWNEIWGNIKCGGRLSHAKQSELDVESLLPELP